MTKRHFLAVCGLFLPLPLLGAAHAQDKPWLLSTPDENAQRSLKEGRYDEVHKRLKDLLEITRISAIFEIYDDEGKAVRAFA